MFETLITKINTTLSSVTEIQVVYKYPETKLSGYPAVVFFANDFSNVYDSTAENSKEYNFTLFVLQETKVAGLSNVYTTIMPKVLDAIIAKFDTDWSQGSTSQGHRIWWTMTSGTWQVINGLAGEMVQAELNLKINVNTNV